MAGEALTVALIHDVFFDDTGAERLARRLDDARARGAELAVLAELALDPWFPAGHTVRPEDAEEVGGRRHRRLSEAARNAGLGVLGGAVVVDAESGQRRNRALVFDSAGALVATYDKLHAPSEEGFWETDQYEVGSLPPARIDAFGLPVGVQICSDLKRPVGCHLLGAQGVAAILAPRGTEAATWDRWRLVMRANAITSCAYLLSVARPGPEAGVELGGPTIVIGPDGQVLAESTEPVTVARLEAELVARARYEYPGYLPVRAELYAAGWAGIAGPGHPPACEP
ncbi:MAG: carbon-nitrogen hydrolase family protein [bacterium]|nr:carbon-nitrogen hydrolase family protein [bacterium]